LRRVLSDRMWPKTRSAPLRLRLTDWLTVWPSSRRVALQPRRSTVPRNTVKPPDMRLQAGRQPQLECSGVEAHSLVDMGRRVLGADCRISLVLVGCIIEYTVTPSRWVVPVCIDKCALLSYVRHCYRYYCNVLCLLFHCLSGAIVDSFYRLFPPFIVLCHDNLEAILFAINVRTRHTCLQYSWRCALNILCRLLYGPSSHLTDNAEASIERFWKISNIYEAVICQDTGRRK